MSSQNNLRTKFKALNFDFHICKLPQLSELSLLKDLRVLPVTLTPMVKGVDILIRSNMCHMVNWPHVIHNFRFKELFLDIFKKTLQYKGTIYCTIYSNIATNDEIVKILNSSDTSAHLPEDLTLQLNDFYLERIADQVPLYARLAQLDYMVYRQVKSNKRIKFPLITKAYNYDEVVDLVNLWAISVPNFKSIIVQNIAGLYSYTQLDIMQSSAVEYSPVKQYTGILKEINYQHSMSEDGKRTRFAVDLDVLFEDIKSFGTVTLRVDICDLTITQRRELANARSVLIGQSLVFEGVDDPKSFIPIHRKFIKFG